VPRPLFVNFFFRGQKSATPTFSQLFFSRSRSRSRTLFLNFFFQGQKSATPTFSQLFFSRSRSRSRTLFLDFFFRRSRSRSPTLYLNFLLYTREPHCESRQVHSGTTHVQCLYVSLLRSSSKCLSDSDHAECGGV
jgi:hypothetical protein